MCGRTSGRCMNCSHCLTIALPGSSAGCALPATTICTGRFARILSDPQRPVQIAENAGEALGVGEQQGGTLVCREAAGETEGQHVGVEQMARLFHGLVAGSAVAAQLASVVLAHIFDQRGAVVGPELPDFFIWELAD